VDGLQKPEELLTAMAAMTFADDFARRHVERGEQRGGPVPPIVVRPTLRRPERHRQNRRGAVERLDLALFVHAQEQRAVRRREIQADNVTDFLDEERIARQLEGLTPMRLQAERAPDAPDGG